MNLFELKNITCVKRPPGREPTTIFKDLNLSIPPSGIFMLMGPSGVGKSTLLRFLNRLEDPTSGEILFKGEPIRSLPVPELRRRVGMLFQLPALPEETVRGNLLYGPALRGKKMTQAELASLMLQVHLEASFLDRGKNELSVGQQQRASLARVLALSPEVLLLDEPTASLDPITAVNIEKTIQELVANSGIQVVWVTHDAAQAERVGNHIIRLPIDS